MNVAQVVVNSLITASELGLIAIGLTLTFSLLKFGNFAHVETSGRRAMSPGSRCRTG
jgi:branched-subunit amino acid ABC-type transport system permease component